MPIPSDPNDPNSFIPLTAVPGTRIYANPAVATPAAPATPPTVSLGVPPTMAMPLMPGATRTAAPATVPTVPVRQVPATPAEPTRPSMSDPGAFGPGNFITPTSYAPQGQPPTVGSFWTNNQRQLRPIATNLAQTASDPRGVIPTIIQAAQAYGIDPNTAVAVAQSEGLTDFTGDEGTSGGAFQLHVGGGMGDEFRRDTGLDPLNPANERQGIWYAMKRASQEGWGAFHGAARTGIDQWQGIKNNQRYVSAASTPGLANREPGQWGREPQDGWGELPRQPMDFQAFMVKAQKMAPFLSGDSAFTQAYMLRAYDAYLKAFQGNQIEAVKYRAAEWQQSMQELSDKMSLENRDIGDAMSSNTGDPASQMEAVRDLAAKYNDRPLGVAADHGPDAVTALMQARDHFGSDTTKTSAALEKQQAQQKQDKEIEDAAQADLAQWKQQNPDATPQQIQGKLFDFRAARRNQLLGKTGGRAQDPGKTEDLAARDAAVEQDVKDKVAAYKDAHDGQEPSDGQVAQFRDDARRAREAKPGAGAGAALKPKVGNYRWTDQGKRHSGQAVLQPGAEGGALRDPDTMQPIPHDPGSVSGESVAATQDVEPPDVPEKWDGMPHKAPPGIDQGIWTQATTYVLTGQRPTFGRDKESIARFREAVPVAMKALGFDEQGMIDHQVRFAAQKGAEAKAAGYYASGRGADQMRSLNTVADHLSLFRQYADALNNGQTVLANRLINRFALETGDPSVTDYEAAKTLMAGEVVRLLTATGGSVTDRTEAQGLADRAFTPQQLQGVADTLTNLVHGRLDALQTGYVNNVPGRSDVEKQRAATDFFQMMTPGAQEVFSHTIPVPGAATPNAPAATYTPQNPNPTLPKGSPSWAFDFATNPQTGQVIYEGAPDQWFNADHTPYKAAP